MVNKLFCHLFGIQKLRILLLVALLISPLSSWAIDSCISGNQIPGTYVLEAEKGYRPNTLSIFNNKTNQNLYPFKLESYWSSKPNDDGSSTTQAYFAGDIELTGCAGTYYSKEDECTVKFSFLKRNIVISHEGWCYSIGQNAAPDGVYIKK